VGDYRQKQLQCGGSVAEQEEAVGAHFMHASKPDI